jgi:hypothetical protein
MDVKASKLVAIDMLKGLCGGGVDVSLTKTFFRQKMRDWRVESRRTPYARRQWRQTEEKGAHWYVIHGWKDNEANEWSVTGGQETSKLPKEEIADCSTMKRKWDEGSGDAKETMAKAQTWLRRGHPYSLDQWCWLNALRRHWMTVATNIKTTKQQQNHSLEFIEQGKQHPWRDNHQEE